ncbi:hypothetical protein GCM10027563_24480 [Parasphingorhabdus pacifica]
MIKRIIRELVHDSDFWFDNHWVVDSTPVPGGMSRPTMQRSDLTTVDAATSFLPVAWRLVLMGLGVGGGGDAHDRDRGQLRAAPPGRDSRGGQQRVPSGGCGDVSTDVAR